MARTEEEGEEEEEEVITPFFAERYVPGMERGMETADSSCHRTTPTEGVGFREDLSLRFTKVKKVSSRLRIRGKVTLGIRSICYNQECHAMIGVSKTGQSHPCSPNASFSWPGLLLHHLLSFSHLCCFLPPFSASSSSSFPPSFQPC